MVMVTLMCRWKNRESPTPVDRKRTHYYGRLKCRFFLNIFMFELAMAAASAMMPLSTEPIAAQVQMLIDALDEGSSQSEC